MSPAGEVADGPMSPARKLATAAEILAAYVRARRLIRRSDLPGAVTALRGEAAGHPPDAAAGHPPDAAAGHPPDAVPAGRRLGRAVVRTLGLLPTDSRCLMRSLVLTALLARRGIESRLIVGVRPGETLLAHAWVEHRGQPLLETGGSRFERLLEL